MIKLSTVAAIITALTLLTASAYAATAKKIVEAPLETKPGPAYQMVDGKLNKIDGNVYLVEDYAGKELKLYVSKHTKKLRGEKKPGDPIRAEVTKGGHANSIQ